MMARTRAMLAAMALGLLSLPAAAQTIGDIRARADAGDANSEYLLGEAYRTGQGVQPDRDAAIGWFRKASAQGDARAADALGLLLFTKGDRQESIPLLFKAAARGDARAQYLLGTAHFNGDGVPRDLPHAYAEMKAAAGQYLPQAIRNLELMEPYISPEDRAAAAQIRIGAMPATVAADMPRPKPVKTVPAPKPVPPAPMPAPMTTTIASVPAFAPPPKAAPASTTSDPNAFVPLPRTELPPSTPAEAPLPAPQPMTIAQTAPAPASRPTAAPGRYRIQLGALGSEAKGEDQWRLLSRRIPELADHTHVVVQAGAIWRLQATGLADFPSAQALCSTIKAKGGDCLVIKP